MMLKSHRIALVMILMWGGIPLLAEDSAAKTAAPSQSIRSIRIQAGLVAEPDLHLHGSEDLRQLLVTGVGADGREFDLTRSAKLTVEPAGIVSINDQGFMTPQSDGTAVVHAVAGENLAVKMTVTVHDFAVNRPVNFPNQIVPILTKYGCNGGGCHGAANGQNGFLLSLLGFESAEDIDHLVKESRGRRISLTAPDESLLLKKAIGSVPHGGGARMAREMPEYQLIRRWIAEGAHPGDAETAMLTGIEVTPSFRLMDRRAEQQLLVLAHYSDGTTSDVTATAVYEPNNPEMASVTQHGLVTTSNSPGDVGIMIRYQSNVAVFRATIPLGAPVENLPPARNFIDEIVFAKLKLLGLPPSVLCSDATFLRRITIDLAGRLPTEKEMHDFLNNSDPAKRDQQIDRLLNSPDYPIYFANKWSTLLRNHRNAGELEQARHATYLFHNWLRQEIQENRPYDEFVRSLMTASGEASENPAVLWYRAGRDSAAQVEDVAQLFLGQRIQCAKCHHHPFEKWSQADYYRMTAFFSQVGRKPGLESGEVRIFHRAGTATASHPRTGERLSPTGLGGDAMEIAAVIDPRVELASWMTTPENPFFARSLVNRYWKHFFGRGLVEPEDDMRATNPPANPELLAALEKHFVESGYDLRDLIRTICQSTAYQLSSEPNAYNEDDRQNFSRFYPRKLTAEVLLDAVDTLTGTSTRFAGMPIGTRAVELPDAGFPSYFLAVFGRPKGESVCECERVNDSNLAQSLHLINSPEMVAKISDASGHAQRLAKAQETPVTEKIRELYAIAYSRPPMPEEVAVVADYLKERALPDGLENPQAYEDLVWSLINTKEFLFNH